MKLILANPRGFCAGVERAIEIVEQILQQFGAPVYVKHEIVHNRYVVNKLKQAGAIFIEDLEQVPMGSILVFSAHGVSQEIRQAAVNRQCQVFDATCPLVTKVHMQVARQARAGHECILIGHKGHPEVEGTLGQYAINQGRGIYLVENEADVADLEIDDPENVMYVSQTTLSVDDTMIVIEALKQRFPSIKGPKRDDICYATQNRQNAVKALATQCQVLLVVGSHTSSNSNRLVELAQRLGCQSYLIDSADNLQVAWFEDVETIGLTAGASAPEVLVQNVVSKLKDWGAYVCEEQEGVKEEVYFSLPKSLRSKEHHEDANIDQSP